MSYTVVVDEQERMRQMENRLNAVARHCKIGKVRYKHALSDLVGVGMPARPKRETFFIDPGFIYQRNQARFVA
ncbi:hypothetical protein CO731_04872 [Aminobacter sp. MSH1]|uniref:hypothetical protein n=1 Tax=Aminobacter sp. MSH1 TaxID=374606 RepID=UPI000D361816|nr:hypothetical protein [Aminobacter sp. MSH1]AWC25377.1 hypothetical protein CO731_04872 [Aminobacter sp. MSH1]